MSKLASRIIFIVWIFHGSVIAQNMNQGEMLSSDVFHQIKYTETKKGIYESVDLKGINFHFLFDTGAPLCISKEIQAQFNFRITDTATLIDSNNKKDTTFIVTIDTISFGGITFINIPAVVLDFKNSPIKNENVEGILGSNMVRFLTVQFDLKNQIITFTDNNTKLNFDRNKSGLLMLNAQSDASIVVKFENSNSGTSTTFIDTAHFDSGMEELYDMNFVTAKRYIFQNSKRVIKRNKASKISSGMLGKGNTAEQMKLSANKLIIGEVNIQKAILYTTAAKSRIGRDLLKYGTLTLDYKNSKYYFQITK